MSADDGRVQRTRRGERIRVPEEWIDHTRPHPTVFADGFTTTVESLGAPGSGW